MKRLKFRKSGNLKLISKKTRYYVDFFIVLCSAIIAWNIQPNQNTDINSSGTNEKKEMIYIFHDYEGNQYILNEKGHGAASSRDYLFDETIPDSIKKENVDNEEVDNEEVNNGEVDTEEINSENEENIEGSVSLAKFGDISSDGDEDNESDINYEGYQNKSDENKLDNIRNNESKSDQNVKNNQVSLTDMLNELGIDDESIALNESESNDYGQTKHELVIDLSSFQNEQGNDKGENNYYNVNEYEDDEGSTMIIEIINSTEDNTLTSEENDLTNDEDDSNNIDNTSHEKDNQSDYKDVNTDENIIDTQDGSLENTGSTAKLFNFISEGWIIPALVPRDEIDFSDQPKSLAYYDNGDSNYHVVENIPISNNDKKSGINIIPDYKSCMTPWGYSIDHGESVLAYQQRDDAPDICNIERRICRNGKLSGTYTQQGCYINENYTYSQWGEAEVKRPSTKENSYETIQNSDGTVTVNKPLTTGSFVFDRPNPTYTDYTYSEDNVRENDKDVGLTKIEHIDCVAPRGEQVKHGQLVQAFKHENGFRDAPCEAQIRLCSMGKLLGSYSESSCKTRDTSFIDWVNGSPTWDTYSQEKLERVKDQMRKEEIYYEESRKNAKRSTKSDNLDQILYILDMN